MARIDVHVDGLKQLDRALKQADPALQKAFRTEMKTLGERIAAKVRARIPRRSGRAAGSVKAGADAKSAYVKGGKASVPYYGWLEYGGVLRPSGGRRNTITRPVVREGRYLMPTVKDERAETLRAAEDAFKKAAKSAGLK